LDVAVLQREFDEALAAPPAASASA
jgi:hypothetical protein